MPKLNRNQSRSYIIKPKKGGATREANKSWGTNHKLYNNKIWKGRRGIRLTYMALANGLCEECMRHGVYRDATVIDHIEPLPPSTDLATFIRMSHPDNLQALCAPHHNQKTQGENV